MAQQVQETNLRSAQGIASLANATRDIAIGIVGTFDVENYGDLLFPLIAGAAAAQRNERIRVVPFSLNERPHTSWPYQVHSTQDLAASIANLSALLIGGGQIIRYDKGYPVASPQNSDVPIDYWLVPALVAAMAGTPVIWNAVGAWTGSPPAPWHDEILRAVFSASYFIGIRDEASRQHLSRIAPAADIQILPDTAFSLSSVWPLKRESEEYLRWRQAVGIDHPYLVIQSNRMVATYQEAIQSILASRPELVPVVLPVCWCHGDRAESFPPLDDKMVLSREWLTPRLLSEILGRSELVIASSLHACITGLSYGVPVVRVPWSIHSPDRKFELLNEFEGVAFIDGVEDVRRVVSRTRRIEPRVLEYRERLERYWDETMDIAANPPLEHSFKSMALMRAWAAKACSEIERLHIMQA